MDPDRLDEIVASIPQRALDELRRRRPRRGRHRPATPARSTSASSATRRPARTACSRATAPSAAPPSATRPTSAAAWRPRASSSRAAGPTRPRVCARSGAEAEPSPARGGLDAARCRLTARHNPRRAPAPAAAARPVPRRRPGPLRGRRGARAAIARGGGGRAATPGRCPTGGARSWRRAGVPVHAGVPGVELLDGIGTVVKSPGVPAEAPVVVAAREARDRRGSASSSSAGGWCPTRRSR